MKSTTPAITLSAALLTLLTACGTAPLAGPPDLKLGRSECHECGMLISEDHCACGLLVEHQGQREHLLFDDIGCMLDAMHNAGGEFITIEAFVLDYPTSRWLTAAEASFVLADPDRLRTPMGSGIAAFASPEDARQEASTHAGTVHDFPAIIPARRAWMQERYGPQDTGPK